MSSIESFVQGVEIPPLQCVRYIMEDNRIADVQSAILDSFEASGLSNRLPKNGRIAIAVGSRGICQLAEQVKSVVEWFKAHDTRPFIVPSMGSHGNATDEDQRMILESLGVSEESMGCPVLSSMAVVELGKLSEFSLPIYMDKHAYEADGIFVINRVKLHTTFTGKHESGLVKMLTIGLGKQAGAASCHALGFAHFPQIMPAMATLILQNHPQVLGGLGIVENAYDHPCHIEVVPSKTFLERDATLLTMSKKVMPALPVKNAEVLIIDRIGKNISGLGSDPNITGRYVSKYKTNNVHMTRMGLLDLCEESHGGASGIGCADVITRRLYDKIDFDATYANVITSTNLPAAATPVVAPSDKILIHILIKTCNCGSHPLRMLRIRDTLSIGRLLVSPALAEELVHDSRCELVGSPKNLEFDNEGNLTDFTTWTQF